MNKRLNLVLLLTTFSLVSCFSQEKQKRDFYFWNYVTNISADTQGGICMEINMFSYKGKETNPYGEAIICMLHKKGGKWWYEQAKKRYPTYNGKPNPYPEDDAISSLFKTDSALLKQYNKWVFVIDKKYLKPALLQEEGDYNPDDPTGERAKNTIFYEVPKGKKYEAILYEQKAGSNDWIELERRELIAGENKETIKDWQEELLKKKLQENP